MCVCASEWDSALVFFYTVFARAYCYDAVFILSQDTKSMRRLSTSSVSVLNKSISGGSEAGHKLTQLAARSEELLSLRAELGRYQAQLNTSRQQSDRLKVIITKLQVCSRVRYGSLCSL